MRKPPRSKIDEAIEKKTPFGRLVVVRRAGQQPRAGKMRALCECLCDCGKTTVILAESVLEGHTQSCGCLREVGGRDSRDWKGCGQLTGSYWIRLLHNAKNRGIAVSMTIEDAWEMAVSQGMRCALSGVPLVFAKGTNQTGSLDRIDSGILEYAGNCRWVHKDINMMKRAFPETRFLFLCRAVANKPDSLSPLAIPSSAGLHPTRTSRGAHEFITGREWSQIHREAARRGFSVEMTIQEAWDVFVRQNARCAITGVPIHFAIPGRGQTSGTASLDRIDSGSKRYIAGGIQWLHKEINWLKYTFSTDYFSQLCRAVANTHPGSTDEATLPSADWEAAFIPKYVPASGQHYRYVTRNGKRTRVA